MENVIPEDEQLQDQIIQQIIEGRDTAFVEVMFYRQEILNSSAHDSPAGHCAECDSTGYLS